MISRSLGIEVGGAVGIPLFIALVLSVAFYRKISKNTLQFKYYLIVHSYYLYFEIWFFNTVCLTSSSPYFSRDCFSARRSSSCILKFSIGGKPEKVSNRELIFLNNRICNWFRFFQCRD